MVRERMSALRVDKKDKVVFKQEVLHTTLSILDLFTEGTNQQADIKILNEFAKRGSLSCPELIELGYSMPTVYRVVKRLKEKKIIVPVAQYTSSKGGGPRTTIYSLLVRGQPF